MKETMLTGSPKNSVIFPTSYKETRIEASVPFNVCSETDEFFTLRSNLDGTHSSLQILDLPRLPHSADFLNA